jgi:hypothetical protein
MGDSGATIIIRVAGLSVVRELALADFWRRMSKQTGIPSTSHVAVIVPWTWIEFGNLERESVPVCPIHEITMSAPIRY